MSGLGLVLASRSPRRAALLDAAGISWRQGPYPDVDETPPEGQSAPVVAQRLAEQKACRVAPLCRGEVVLAADTVVFMGDELLGKPAGPGAARDMLSRLAGRTHGVATGVALARDLDLVSAVAAVDVTFRPLSAQEIDAYVATGEPLDKAGAYGIQGGAASFVVSRKGPEDVVVGLPVALVRTLYEALTGYVLVSEAGNGR